MKGSEMIELREYCGKCRRVTPSRSIDLPNGIEFVCEVCGAQVDYLQHTDDDDYGCCELCGGELLGNEFDGICGICWELEIDELDG